MGLTFLSSIKSRHTNNKVLSPYDLLLLSNPPWAIYSGSSLANDILPDESGHGRDAICANITRILSPIGNGSSVPHYVIKGIVPKPNFTLTVNSAFPTVTFPDGSIPVNHTIFFLNRYSNAYSQNRMLYDRNSSYYLGNMTGGLVGAFYDGVNYITTNASQTSNPKTNWAWMGISSGGSVPNNVLVNGVSKGINLVSPITGGKLATNSNLTAEVKQKLFQKIDLETLVIII
jgi:hypothetical protein